MNAATAAIDYALNECEDNDDACAFLRNWNEGAFDILRENWENIPEEVFIGADPQHPLTQLTVAAEMRRANCALDAAVVIAKLPAPSELAGGATQYTAKVQLEVERAIVRYLKGQPVAAWQASTHGIISEAQRLRILEDRGLSENNEKAAQNIARFNVPLIAIDCNLQDGDA